MWYGLHVLSILYRDEKMIAVDKPSGLLVHATRLVSKSENQLGENCMFMLRDQIGVWVYPVNRLDRATSGVLVFALSPESASQISSMYAAKRVEKTYYAIVRGWVDEKFTVDYPLKKLRKNGFTGPASPAVTHFERVAQIELPVAVSKHPTSRYSLVRAITNSGRLHQVRRHLAHVFHPIIGDTIYGDGKHNRFFRERFNVHRLLLAAQAVRMPYPSDETKELQLSAPLPAVFSEIFGSVIPLPK
jgi:tRNA pseudouridine65 synthase